jgi:hypothetical protein
MASWYHCSLLVEGENEVLLPFNTEQWMKRIN